MAKLTATEKRAFIMNRETMKSQGVKWAFCRETGITLIYKEMPLGNFIKVSVAYCNKQDTFKKKLGFNVAVKRWALDDAIQIPNSAHFTESTVAGFASYLTQALATLTFMD